MKFAKKLFDIMMKERAVSTDPFIKKIKKEAEKAANDARSRCRVDFKGKVCHARTDIAEELYEEGFSVFVEYYPTLGCVDFTIDWGSEEPKKPRYTTYNNQF
ncbi:hypothetical protein Blue_047 [Bacillus phage Deep Blue]|uniref:Uncharacterized protein n=1 Tax=Bacillus phage Deep Blue TaxID=1792245 RepID=A0A140HLK8_9CAUD|nr:hypothetical protein Blue_047 [Bacillus phage Deep Blue]AMO25870.1 hypothetical protein Blue_047 [Bacillus phage Deep Blue]